MPKMNDIVENANKNIKNIIQKMVVICKNQCGMFLYALYTYHNALKTSTRSTPYSHVYGINTIMPLKVEIPSLGVLMRI
jgi:hypothetical protein